MAVSIYARAETKPAAQPADKNAAAAAKAKAGPATAAAPAVQPGKKAERPAAARSKQAEPEDDGTVMIDSRSDVDETGRAPARADAAAGEREEADIPGGMPISYGQCKGVISDGGRNLLVFESPDDGTITFVQVIAGRSSVSWKVAGTIGRSSD
ncbi:MAG TPA: hypothetical protein DCZ92_13625 [Elusimicrobia bacterium]|nr:MAG: hypothetical protein A2016_08635 [Elusimicrobia bacterium GWF2_62_30]HBA61821.1 hypothetical protein [Elusimicrobiota bacterium]